MWSDHKPHERQLLAFSTWMNAECTLTLFCWPRPWALRKPKEMFCFKVNLGKAFWICGFGHGTKVIVFPSRNVQHTVVQNQKLVCNQQDWEGESPTQHSANEVTFTLICLRMLPFILYLPYSLNVYSSSFFSFWSAALRSSLPPFVFHTKATN